MMTGKPLVRGGSSGTGGEQTSSILDELIRRRSTTTSTASNNKNNNTSARVVLDQGVGSQPLVQDNGQHDFGGTTTSRRSLDDVTMNESSPLIDAENNNNNEDSAILPTWRRQPYGNITTNDGVKIFYEHFGASSSTTAAVDKPVVVLIHGWSGSRHYWDLNVRLIARYCKVVTFDLRHHGDSEKPPVGFHVARLASDLRDLLVALQLNHVTVVGASMGASIIWSYFELFGIDGRIDKAVFVDQAPLQNLAPDWRGGSTGCYDIQSLTRLQCRVVEDFKGFARDNARFCSSPGVPEDVLSVLESETLRASNTALAALMADHTALDWRPVLSRITIPCLNMIGKKSAVFPYWGCEEVSRLLPNCRTVYFENENHWLYIEQPERFSKIVSLFARHGFDAFVTKDMAIHSSSTSTTATS
jgi:non-heme chloroperoxidase